jgi:large subunit ribosomal protein L30
VAGETVKEKSQKTIHIKWVRSAIAFPRHQKTMVRSLGLGRLNQVVERPDTPQIRGLVEAMPHLVAIVSPPVKPAWMAVPEYTIFPPDPAEQKAPAPKRKAKAPEEPVAESEREKVEAKAKPEKAPAHAEHAAKGKKPAKAAAAKTKAEKASEAKKSKAAKSSKPAKKTKR